MALNTYRIEQKVLTMADLGTASFVINNIEFSNWKSYYHDGKSAWIAKTILSAADHTKAYKNFLRKLSLSIRRIALISQAYIEYKAEPLLIYKINSDAAVFRYTDSRVMRLTFTQNEKSALYELLKNKQVPEDFYYYWNDLVNTTGYSAKLLLMFSAIEALVPRDPKVNEPVQQAENRIKEEKRKLNKKILGKRLYRQLYGMKGNSHNALRNRLAHGEYCKQRDLDKDYVELFHRKMIAYFNNEILSSPLIPSNVINPQRSISGDKRQLTVLLRAIGNFPIDLKHVLIDIDENGLAHPKQYEYVMLWQFLRSFKFNKWI